MILRRTNNTGRQTHETTELVMIIKTTRIADTKIVDMAIGMVAVAVDITMNVDKAVEDTIIITIKIAKDSTATIVATVAVTIIIAIMIIVMTEVASVEIEDMVAVTIIQTIASIRLLTKSLTWTRSTRTPTTGCTIRTTLPSSVR